MVLVEASAWSTLGAEGLKILLELVAALVATVLLPRIPGLTKAAFDAAKSKAGTMQNQFAAGILSRLAIVVEDKVLAWENTVIEDLKEKAADGRLSKDELTAEYGKLKDKFQGEVKDLAQAQKLWEMGLAVFGGSEEALKKWLDQTKEAAVAKLPPSGLQSSVDGVHKPALALTKPEAPPVPPPAAP